MVNEGDKNAEAIEDDNDSDVEIEGMDLEDDDEEMEEAEKSSNAETTSSAVDQEDEEAVKELEHEDHDEMEAARKEQMELMASESKKVAQPTGSSVSEQLQYLLNQSEVFAHFLAGKSKSSHNEARESKRIHSQNTLTLTQNSLSCAGSVAATSKKGKKGSRGKKGRMTEAEEDEAMLKSAQSKRRVIRLDKQPSILADHCKMHGYQLEGLNWLIKLHCNGINGILADEVSGTSDLRVACLD